MSRHRGLAVIVFALAMAAQPARSEETMVLGLPTPPSVSFGNFYMAEQAGYLKQEGLTLKLLSVDGTGPVMQLLLSGNIPVAAANPSWLLMARQPGKPPAPVRFFYNYNRTSVWTIAVLPASPIKTVADLAHRTIGVPNVNTGTNPIIKAILNDAGVTDAEVDYTPVGAGVPAWIALKNGSIDALTTIKTWRARMETKGFQSRVLPLPEQYATIPSLGFIARDETIAHDPHMLVGFARAVAKATIFCDANPEPCVRAFWAAHPEQAPSSPGDEAEAMAHDVHVLKSDLVDQLRFADGEEKLLGHYPAAAWKVYADSLQRAGEITEKDIPLDRLYTEELLGSINDFDAAAVRDQARGWKG